MSLRSPLTLSFVGQKKNQCLDNQCFEGISINQKKKSLTDQIHLSLHMEKLRLEAARSKFRVLKQKRGVYGRFQN